MLYIAIMFKALSGLSAGVSASIALAHDLFVMIALYSVLQLPINTIFVAALAVNIIFPVMIWVFLQTAEYFKKKGEKIRQEENQE